MNRSRSTEKDDDAKSTSSNLSLSKGAPRKTPAQVKADAAARKGKVSLLNTLFYLTRHFFCNCSFTVDVVSTAE